MGNPLFSYSTDRRAFLGLAGAATAGALLAGCAAQPTVQPTQAPATENDLVERAKADGRLVVYATATGQLLDPLVDAFQAKYGIQVEVLRIAVAQMMPRFASEMEGGIANADILQISLEAFLEESIEKKWIVKNDFKDLPEGWSEEHWNGYYARLATGPILMSYNTNLVAKKDVPNDWEDVLHPKWKGKLLFVDPTAGTTWTPWIHLMHQTYGDDFLTGLARQELKVVTSNVAGSQQLAAGEASLLLPTSPWAIGDLVDQGAPIANIEAFSPTVHLPHHISVVASAPRPAAAELFMRYSLSVEGQTDVVSSGYAASVLPDIPGSMVIPEGTQDATTEGNAFLNDYKKLLGLAS